MHPWSKRQSLAQGYLPILLVIIIIITHFFFFDPIAADRVSSPYLFPKRRSKKWSFNKGNTLLFQITQLVPRIQELGLHWLTIAITHLLSYYKIQYQKGKSLHLIVRTIPVNWLVEIAAQNDETIYYDIVVNGYPVGVFVLIPTNKSEEFKIILQFF